MNQNLKTILKVLGVLAGIPVLFLAFLIFVLGPVDTRKENSVEVKGEIVQIFEGPSYDIVFRVAGKPNTYYINRGIESGLELEALEHQLIGEQVSLWYAKSWPTSGGHITHLSFQGEVLYSEW